MICFFNCLENTFNKSAAKDISAYFTKYSYVTKWMIASDYCLENGEKNNVFTFVYIPYMNTFDEICKNIDSVLPKDIKNTRTITDEKVKLLHDQELFSISFVLHPNHYFCKYQVEAFVDLCDTYIAMLNKWTSNQPDKAEYYLEMIAKLASYREKCRQTKNFNKKLNQHMLMLSFFASYCFYLIYKHHPPIEIISWYSDRDKMINMENGIVYTLFELQENNLSQLLPSLFHPQVCYGVPNPKPGEKEMWFDSIIRLADYICGVLADYKLADNLTSHPKHTQLVEQLVADNNNLVVIEIKENGTGRRVTEAAK